MYVHGHETMLKIPLQPVKSFRGSRRVTVDTRYNSEVKIRQFFSWLFSKSGSGPPIWSDKMGQSQTQYMFVVERNNSGGVPGVIWHLLCNEVRPS